MILGVPLVFGVDWQDWSPGHQGYSSGFLHASLLGQYPGHAHPLRSGGTLQQSLGWGATATSHATNPQIHQYPALAPWPLVTRGRHESLEVCQSRTCQNPRIRVTGCLLGFWPLQPHSCVPTPVLGSARP